MTNDYGNLELHQVLLAAMKDIDRICRENGLRYYLYAGTLLGAMNHKGFIPWDDDVDLVMFPDEFKRLAEVIQKQYSDRYEMVDFENTPMWFSKMNKLRIKGTTLSADDAKEFSPFFVDICVLHNIPDRNWQRWFQRKQIEMINLVLAVKSGAVVPTSFKAKATLGVLARGRKEFWGKQLDRVMGRYDRKDTEYVGIMCNTLTRNPYTGRTGYDTDLTKRAWHEAPQDVSFEDWMFMTYSNVEDYLTYQFGPHWAEPYPEEKRKTKHGIITYSISPEVREWVGL